VPPLSRRLFVGSNAGMAEESRSQLYEFVVPKMDGRVSSERYFHDLSLLQREEAVPAVD